jgi:DNA-binding CsgD family transcriptional regulator
MAGSFATFAMNEQTNAPETLPSDQLTLPWPELTIREREVAVRLAVGQDREEIAAALGVTARTYDTHRTSVMVKLGCKNNVQLALRALREGVVTL